MRFTPAQKRALEWLPSDGSWRTHPGKIAQAIASLSSYYRSFVEAQVGPFGPRGGHTWRYRLTSAGVAAKHPPVTEKSK